MIGHGYGEDVRNCQGCLNIHPPSLWKVMRVDLALAGWCLWGIYKSVYWLRLIGGRFYISTVL